MLERTGPMAAEIREWEWEQADIAWAHYGELQVRLGEVRGSRQRV